MISLICDSETDGFLAVMTKLHMLQIGDANGDDAEVYCDGWPGCRPFAEGLERLAAADETIWHSGIGFDRHVMRRFSPGVVDESKMLDTLVMARLAFPEEKSHQLEAWGRRLDILKGNFKGPWDRVTQEMIDYARNDVVVGRALYAKVKHVREWGESCDLEHAVARVLDAQEKNGFRLDIPRAIELEGQLRAEVAELDKELQVHFPPLQLERTWESKATNSKFGYKKGVPFTKRWTEVFEASSRHHVARRLQAAGWKPAKWNDDGTPSTDEAVLSRLKHPAAQVLCKRAAASKMLAQVSDGKTGWLKIVHADGRVRGRVNSNGAVTGRMTHSSPNMANVDSDERTRALWIPRDGWRLVGVDAEGLEARILGHYLTRYDGGNYNEMLLNGNKDLGTDVHSTNAKWINKLGYPIDRDGAKTVLYALLFGAGDVKLGMTVQDRLRELGLPKINLPPREIGALVRKALMRSIKGLKDLTDDLVKTLKANKYIRGIDGRHMAIRSTHSILNSLCQGNGALAMKKALALFWDLHGSTHGTTWGLCANVHDEVQLEAHPDIAEALGQSFADCIRLAGEHFSLKCPLAGKAAVGDNWSETH